MKADEIRKLGSPAGVDLQQPLQTLLLREGVAQLAELNANLLAIANDAAAPDLLKALEWVEGLYSTMGLRAHSPECGPMINSVRAAIAKAKRETP